MDSFTTKNRKYDVNSYVQRYSKAFSYLLYFLEKEPEDEEIVKGFIEFITLWFSKDVVSKIFTKFKVEESLSVEFLSLHKEFFNSRKCFTSAHLTKWLSENGIFLEI